jgi:hypothetical protein
MPEIEDLTPDGTDVEIETETPETETQTADTTVDDAAALRAELEAEKAAREAAERKFSESSKEANILLAQNKTLQERQTFTNQPTEDDLRKAIPNYDAMVPNEQFIAAQNYRLEQKLTAIEAKEKQRDADTAWDREISKFAISDAKLDGREDEFKKFANKPTHRGVDLSLLKSAFLNETTTEAKVERSPGLERGSGGTRDVTTTKKWDAETVLNLKKNNPKEFHRLLVSGQLNPDDIE